MMTRVKDLPRVRFHDLRHSHATQLLLEGVHPKIAQERLGHSTITTTLDLYSHVTDSMQVDAAERLDAAGRPRLPNPGPYWADTSNNLVSSIGYGKVRTECRSG